MGGAWKDETMHHDQIELPALNGARVLVAQNDQFIAADLDLMIDDAGGKVVALAASRDDALFLLGREPIDAAVVDPNLGDGEAASLIEALNRRDIPFVISMGVRDRRGALHRSEADARLGADAVLVLKRPSRGPGAEPTPPIPRPRRQRFGVKGTLQLPASIGWRAPGGVRVRIEIAATT
jgi:CheY-like chemotaxis protein